MEFAPIRLFEIASYLRAGEHFHLANKALDPAKPQFLHRHDYFELFLVLDGAARHWINGEQEPVARGDMVFIRPDDAHAFQADPDCRILNVMFTTATAAHLVDRYGAEFAGRFFWHQGRRPERITLDGPRLERAVNVGRELHTTRRSLVRIEHFLLSILLHVVPHRALVEGAAPRWLIRACAAAERPEVFRQGAAGFVALAGRGHEHVCRQTALYLGMSPTAFINKLRMQHAAKRLGEGDATIDEVAQDCGIANLSHFYKLFRAHYGTTPRDYRLRHQRDPVQQG